MFKSVIEGSGWGDKIEIEPNKKHVDINVKGCHNNWASAQLDYQQLQKLIDVLVWHLNQQSK